MKKTNLIYWTLFISSFLIFNDLNATVKLPAILGSNMVLQQNKEVAIWGWADKEENIKITTSWNNQIVNTKTDQNTKWKASLKTPKAGGPYTITVEGQNTIVLENVLIGEVWLCSGQSNMERQLGLRPGQKPIVNYWEAAQKADIPEIRLFIVKKALSDQALEDCEGEWVVCDSKTVLDFSAAGYFFGKKIYDELSIPVGLIQSAWGGTPVEGWTQKSAMNNEFLLKKEKNSLDRYIVDSIAYAANLAAYEQGFLKDMPVKPQSWIFKNNRQHHKIGALYNAMIHPLINFSIQGAIWYQGESNRSWPKQYKKQFPNMIRTWRKDWGIGNFPFYFVQIAPYHYSGQFAVPPLWEAQYEALTLPNTGMASTHDIGQIYDIHPPEKEEVGRRLALIALNKAYGKTEVVYSGPVLKSTRYEGNEVHLEFDPMGGTLFSSGRGIGGISSFYISGERRIFYPAEVRQEGNTLILTAEEIPHSAAARYLWNDRANATIFNSYGLPAAAFRTDDWEDGRYDE